MNKSIALLYLAATANSYSSFPVEPSISKSDPEFSRRLRGFSPPDMRLDMYQKWGNFTDYLELFSAEDNSNQKQHSLAQQIIEIRRSSRNIYAAFLKTRPDFFKIFCNPELFAKCSTFENNLSDEAIRSGELIDQLIKSYPLDLMVAAFVETFKYDELCGKSADIREQCVRTQKKLNKNWDDKSSNTAIEFYAALLHDHVFHNILEEEVEASSNGQLEDSQEKMLAFMKDFRSKFIPSYLTGLGTGETDFSEALEVAAPFLDDKTLNFYRSLFDYGSQLKFDEDTGDYEYPDLDGITVTTEFLNPLAGLIPDEFEFTVNTPDISTEDFANSTNDLAKSADKVATASIVYGAVGCILGIVIVALLFRLWCKTEKACCGNGNNLPRVAGEALNNTAQMASSLQTFINRLTVSGGLVNSTTEVIKRVATTLELVNNKKNNIVPKLSIMLSNINSQFPNLATSTNQFIQSLTPLMGVAAQFVGECTTLASSTNNEQLVSSTAELVTSLTTLTNSLEAQVDTTDFRQLPKTITSFLSAFETVINQLNPSDGGETGGEQSQEVRETLSATRKALTELKSFLGTASSELPKANGHLAQAVDAATSVSSTARNATFGTGFAAFLASAVGAASFISQG